MTVSASTNHARVMPWLPVQPCRNTPWPPSHSWTGRRGRAPCCVCRSRSRVYRLAIAAQVGRDHAVSYRLFVSRSRHASVRAWLVAFFGIPMRGCEAHDAVVLAAQGNARLATPKQLLTVAGETLLQRAVRMAKATGPTHLMVVLGAHAEQLASLVTGTAILFDPTWEEGVASSLRRRRQPLPAGRIPCWSRWLISLASPRSTSTNCWSPMTAAVTWYRLTGMPWVRQHCFVHRRWPRPARSRVMPPSAGYGPAAIRRPFVAMPWLAGSILRKTWSMRSVRGLSTTSGHWGRRGDPHVRRSP